MAKISARGDHALAKWTKTYLNPDYPQESPTRIVYVLTQGGRFLRKIGQGGYTLLQKGLTLEVCTEWCTRRGAIRIE